MYITKNSIFRKLSIISLALLLYIATLFSGYNRSAYASTIASEGFVLGDGFEAVFKYIAGALMVSGGAAAVADEYGAEVKESAGEAFTKLSEASKEAWKTSVNAAVSAGKTTLAFNESMINDLGIISDYIGEELSLLFNKVEPVKKGYVSTSVFYVSSGQYYLQAVGDISGFKTGLANRTQLKYNPTTRAFYYYSGGWYLINSAFTVEQNAIIAPMVKTYMGFLKAYETFVGPISVQYNLPESPTKDVFNANVDKAVSDLSGVKEVNIPLDNFLATNAAGQSLSWDKTNSTWLNPDGTIYTGDVAWDIPVALPTDMTGISIATPSVPIGGLGVGDIPFIPPAVTIPPIDGSPLNPSNWMPVALLLALFDLLKSILLYLVRMFTFILTIPLIPAIPIDNIAFAWFRNAKIIGVEIYNVVSSMASIGLSFLVYKAIRRLLP